MKGSGGQRRSRPVGQSSRRTSSPKCHSICSDRAVLSLPVFTCLYLPVPVCTWLAMELDDVDSASTAERLRRSVHCCPVF